MVVHLFFVFIEVKMAFDTYSVVFDSGKNADKEYYPAELERIEYKPNSTVLVIDGDILAYKLASIGDDRVCLVSKGEKSKEYKNRTEFKKRNKNKGWDFSEFTFTDILKPKPIDYCIGTLKVSLKNIIEKTKATHVEIYIGGSENFRLDLPLPTLYKGQRKSLLRPTYLSECKDYLIKHHGAIKIKGVEADDYVQQRMFELNSDNVNCILYSNDKDALQSYRHDIAIYNPDKDETRTFVGGIGEMWIQSEKYVKGSGLKWLIGQSLFGDSSDGYKGNDLTPVDYGDKSYYKDVSGITTEKELLEYSVSKWKSWYPEAITYTDCFGNTQTKDWLGISEMYWSCCYMRISDNDNTTYQSLLKEYGVDY